MRKSFLFSSLLLVITLISCTTRSPVYTSIPLDDFGDSINHWVNRTGESEVRRYKPNQILEIADNILLYQRDNGGWPTNKHPARILTEEEKAQILEEKALLDGSFDNRNVYPQVEYLSWVYLQTGDIRYREGALDGLRYTLDKQYANGGWAHSPDRTEHAYYRHITFADDIMPDILAFLRKVAVGAHPYGYVARELREEAAEAVRKGDELLLRLQVVQDGELTVWAGQYHEETLEPAGGRSYELPALQTWESTSVVKYLMSLEDPSEDVIAAVEGAIQWFVRSAIHGMRLERFEIEPLRFPYHTATHDRRLVPDLDAEPIWARFYDLRYNHPFMANRDGNRVYRLEEVHIERRTGYDWYGTWPKQLLEEDYPAWRARLNP